MIYATGDTHGNFQRFKKEYFPEQANMTRDDYMIICGDFGGVWDGGKEENWWLDWLEKLPFTTLFVDGNHENYDLLATYPVEEWHGGKVQYIRPHVIHLMRGQIFELQGYTFFTMGGAQSHDIRDGILDPAAPDFKVQREKMWQRRAQFRVEHRSWWREELPSDEEYEAARTAIKNAHHEVDYIITHCAPTNIAKQLCPKYAPDRLTDFFDEVAATTKFHYWIFGHYHNNKNIEDKYVLLWEMMVRIV